MAIHAGILAWKIPWTEEPDRLYRGLTGHTESDTTELLTTGRHFSVQIFIFFFLHSCWLSFRNAECFWLSEHFFFFVPPKSHPRVIWIWTDLWIEKKIHPQLSCFHLAFWLPRDGTTIYIIYLKTYIFAKYAWIRANYEEKSLTFSMHLDLAWGLGGLGFTSGF